MNLKPCNLGSFKNLRMYIQVLLQSPTHTPSTHILVSTAASISSYPKSDKVRFSHFTFVFRVLGSYMHHSSCHKSLDSLLFSHPLPNFAAIRRHPSRSCSSVWKLDVPTKFIKMKFIQDLHASKPFKVLHYGTQQMPSRRI